MGGRRSRIVSFPPCDPLGHSTECPVFRSKLLLDSSGRAIVRRKHYGLTRGPAEYILADPPQAGELATADVIGSAFLPAEEEELDDDDSGPTCTLST